MITRLAHWTSSSLSFAHFVVCVLLAIMPKIWLTSRLLLFIMIHFARFYGCPAPNAVAQWSLQRCERSLQFLQQICRRFDHILFHSISLIRHSCGPTKCAVLFILTYKFYIIFCLQKIKGVVPHG